MRKRAITLKDISRDVGVSLTQVSRALGGFDDVNADTRRRIQESALRLGYRPNTIARGIRTGLSDIVAMVVPASIDSSAREVMFEIVTGISTAVFREDLKLVLHVSQPHEDPAMVHERLFQGGGIDGFVVIEPVVEDPRIRRLKELGVPHVVHGRDPASSHPFVDLDNIAVARAMAACLASHGHRDIAFLNGPKGAPFSEARSEGFHQALGDIGKRRGTLTVLSGVMTAERGEQDAHRLLKRPNRPTGIIAGNLMIARGVYRAARRMGLRIPDDLSVLGHDDGLAHYPTASFEPEVGGTRSWLEEAWADLAACLRRAIEDGPEDAANRLLEPSFHARGSVARPPS